MSLEDPRFWLLALIVVGAYAVEAATGFGATVIAVSLGMHLFPLEVLLPVLVPLGLVLSAGVCWRERAHADRSLLLRRILPLMGVGLGIGLLLFERASNAALQRAFGVFVLGVAASELWRGRHGAIGGVVPSPFASSAAMLAAGVIHGLFSSGGPLLVWALGRAPIAKRVFRATLFAVWPVLGATLSVAYALKGHLDAGSLRATGALLPALGLALVAGDRLHHRLDEARFRRLVYSLLLLAGVANVL